ncbi:hypothetical protein KAI32_02625 [Candidatus Pacearchaeota archaeon]|nr:hypothetical protein [Thermodesulfovibrionia bacterium]MCK5449736.1 hypothetical protein [Candidatus Pacearchaeota archaeon]
MEKTTIQIGINTLERLKRLKRFERESYDEVINVIIEEYENEELTSEEIDEINVALKNVRLGKIKSIEEVAKELGVCLE